MAAEVLHQHEPAYLRIAAQLRERIERGALAADAPLPPQRALSREFGVTLMTLRQAVDLLKREKLVVTRQGVGTFVAPRRFSYALGPLRSLAQEMAAQGLEMTTRVLAQGERPVDPAIAAALGLAEDRAYTLERLRSVDGAVVVHQRSHLPPALGAAVARLDLSRRSLYDVLAEELGLEVGRARERLWPVALPAREARLLEQRPGAPAVASERVTLTAGGRPLLHDFAYLPGDRLVIAADRLRDDVSIRYELRDRAAPADGRRSA
jgi:GntR family transcriptional regulator